MVLVDERILEHLYHKQDSNWKKSTDRVAKFKLPRQLKTDLNQNDIADDVKVETYNQDLTRLLNATTSIVAEKDITAPVEENKITRHKGKPSAATPVLAELVTRRKLMK